MTSGISNGLDTTPGYHRNDGDEGNRDNLPDIET